MKRRRQWSLVPALAALGVHAALVGVFVWLGMDRYDEATVGEVEPTTFDLRPRHKPVSSTTAKPVKSQRTTFTPAPTAPQLPTALPPLPMPSFTAPPTPTKRILATASTSGITLPAPTPKAAPAPAKASARAASPPAPSKPAAPATDAGGYTSASSLTYTRRVKPVYPAEALRKKLTGTVLLMVYVNETGTVDRVEVLESSGVPSLDNAAINAEQRSRIAPLVKNGVALKFKAKVRRVFQLE